MDNKLTLLGDDPGFSVLAESLPSFTFWMLP